MSEVQGSTTVERHVPGFLADDVSAATEFYESLMGWSADVMPLSSIDVDGGSVPESWLAAADHVSPPSRPVASRAGDDAAPNGWLALVESSDDVTDSLWKSLLYSGA